LPAGIAQDAGDLEVDRDMQADRADVVAVADDRHHLPGAERLAAPDQFAEEGAAGATALQVGRDVDGVLDAVAVGRPRPILVGVREAGDPPGLLDDDPGPAAGDYCIAATAHLGFV